MLETLLLTMVTMMTTTCYYHHYYVKVIPWKYNRITARGEVIPLTFFQHVAGVSSFNTIHRHGWIDHINAIAYEVLLTKFRFRDSKLRIMRITIRWCVMVRTHYKPTIYVGFCHEEIICLLMIEFLWWHVVSPQWNKRSPKQSSFQNVRILSVIWIMSSL